MLHDGDLLVSLWNTLVIGLLYVPPMLILALLLALALNTSWLRARAFFRASIFLPCVGGRSSTPIRELEDPEWKTRKIGT